MEFWQAVSMVNMDELPELAIAAEELQFDGLIFGDHLVTQRTPPDQGDHKITWSPSVHWPDPWIQIAALSQITHRLQFMTGVYVLPLRDPVTVAKSLSTVSYIARNRVRFGIGIGWQQPEFLAVNQSFRDRGRRTDEMLAIIRRLITGEMFEHQGQFYQFEALQMSPGLTVIPPFYVGGYSPAALRRAAGQDGWIGGALSLEAIRSITHELRRERSRIYPSPKKPFAIVSSLQEMTPLACRAASALGVSAIYNRAWVDEKGHATPVSLKTKINELRWFSETIILPYKALLKQDSGAWQPRPQTRTAVQP